MQWSKVGTVIAGVFAVSVAAGAALFRDTPQFISAFHSVQAPVQAIREIFVPNPTELFGKESIRVLIVGLDYDYDKLDQETSKSSRSDVIMALNLDFKNRRIYELSIPRDMVATLPNGQRAKINQAQSDGGIRESKQVVADWLGIPSFDRYVIIRINAAKDIVNALGGIDLNVQNSNALKHQGANGPLDYDDNWGHLHVHLKPGLQHLNGEDAVGYARFRHDWCSDPCRILRQQQVMHAIVDRIEHNQFNTITHAQQLLAVMRKDTQTDFSTDEELASAMTLAHIHPGDIHTAQVPYVGSINLPDYGDSILPDEKARQTLVDSMLLNPPDPVASNTQTAPANATDTVLRVRVENGTTVPGLAAKIAANLRRQGFTIAEIKNAPNQHFKITEIQAASRYPNAPYRIQKALGDLAASAHLSSVNPDTTSDAVADVTVVLGSDIVGSTP